LTIQANRLLINFPGLRTGGTKRKKTHLTQYSKVVPGSHIWMGESMISDIMASIESHRKYAWIIKDVTADHEMCCYQVI